MTSALVLLADGTEEMEAVIAIDTLRRARWRVVAAGLSAREVVCSRQVHVVCDAVLASVETESFDVLVIPGGAVGTDNLAGSPVVLDLVRKFAASGRLVCAVCAGPLVLQAAGVLKGHKATCHPAVVEKLTECRHVDQRVVVDGNLVTSQGPGTSMEFALAIIAKKDGPDAATAVRAGLVL